jgi:hypothetical protein
MKYLERFLNHRPNCEIASSLRSSQRLLFLLLPLLFILSCSSTPSKTANTEKKEDTSKTVSGELGFPELPPIKDPLAKRVWILAVENRSSFNSLFVSKISQDTFQTFFSRFPKLILVGNEEIGPNEPQLMRTELGPTPLAFETAKKHGVSGILSVNINSITLLTSGDERGLLRSKAYEVLAVAEMKLYDVVTRQPIYQKKESVKTQDEKWEFATDSIEVIEETQARKAVIEVLGQLLKPMPNLASRLSWSGRIAKVEWNRYYITGGYQTGITKGQILKVFEEGKEIQDPATGKPMGQSPGRFKGTLKIVDTFGADASVATLHSGAGIKENDRVELYAPSR